MQVVEAPSIRLLRTYKRKEAKAIEDVIKYHITKAVPVYISQV